LHELSREEARQFVNWMHEQFQPQGVKNRMKAVRAFYQFLVNEEVIGRNPFHGFTVKVEYVPRPQLTDEDVERIVKRAKRTITRHPERDYAVLMLLVETGSRKAEVAGLRINDVDLNHG